MHASICLVPLYPGYMTVPDGWLKVWSVASRGKSRNWILRRALRKRGMSTDSRFVRTRSRVPSSETKLWWKASSPYLWCLVGRGPEVGCWVVNLGVPQPNLLTTLVLNSDNFTGYRSAMLETAPDDPRLQCFLTSVSLVTALDRVYGSSIFHSHQRQSYVRKIPAALCSISSERNLTAFSVRTDFVGLSLHPNAVPSKCSFSHHIPGVIPCR